MKTVRDDLDYLRHIEHSLRTLPRKQVNGGALVVELLDDSITGWCEFFREVIETAEHEIASDNAWARRTGWMGNVNGLGTDPDTR